MNNNWISVKDKLPELTKGYPESCSITQYIFIAMISGEEKISCPGIYRHWDGKWEAFTNYGRLKEITDEYTVTHWMPVPEPPKGD